ncbi:acyl-ACP desaturase [Segniliparus rugosus]|uniref:acyl-ACP desaturase n=1 Tax=Segniliparus rugosus TaxID=286804 RepID=UPI001B7F9BB7|nr:acyl-ACP desaturase [Segniliparus rugosus]
MERRLLRELRDVLPQAYREHLEATQEWFFHDYIPWEAGQTFAFLGGKDWDPSRVKLAEPLVAALDLLLLDKDNLPSYNRIFTSHMHLREGWHQWIGQWTAEEGAHAIALRDYLVVTGATDPVLLEKRRLAHVWKGVEYPGGTPLQTLAFGALHEWVTRDLVCAAIKAAAEEPVLQQLLERIAEDEERHAAFFGKVIRRGLEVAPDQLVIAFAAHLREAGSAILGSDIDDYERPLAALAESGIHSEATQRTSVASAFAAWGVLDITEGLSDDGLEAASLLREYAAKK